MKEKIEQLISEKEKELIRLEKLNKNLLSRLNSFSNKMLYMENQQFISELKELLKEENL